MKSYEVYGYDMRNQNKKMSFTTRSVNAFKAKEQVFKSKPYFVVVSVYPSFIDL